MPETKSREMSDIEVRVVEELKQFSANNPTIVEALGVMNMTMPDYVMAMDALRGGQIIAVSAYEPLPLQINA